jgi:predicted regulator of Ras-like GTPase activity (Roadblock/LC7/MglB family)
MSFLGILKEVTDSVKGSKGAAIVGMDGIAVEEYTGETGVDMASLGAEYGNILKGIQQASESLDMGGASELAVMAKSGEVILRKINDDYFIALLMSPKANLGQGRFAVRIAAGRLESEF